MEENESSYKFRFDVPRSVVQKTELQRERERERGDPARPTFTLNISLPSPDPGLGDRGENYVPVLSTGMSLIHWEQRPW